MWPTKWARWLLNPYRLGEPHRFKAGDEIRSGPQSGLPGYLAPAVWGSPTASKRGLNQKWPTKWARWLLNPCRLGETHRFKAGDYIRSGPESAQGGYLTPAVSGSPCASERGTESEVAHKVGKVAT